MPFQSEKQRRYLWANEPELARDWTDTYGNRIQKNDGGIMHHFQNYAQNDGNNVSVPRSFQARPQSEQVNLAYITPQEQQMLQALKPGTPHRGPMEIPNYDSFDAAGGYTSGTAMSAAETGSSNQRDRAEVRASNIGGPKGLAPGVTSNEAQALRNSFLAAGAMGQRGSGIGGFFGGLGRGLMSFFGGIPGRIASGYMTAKDWATKRGQNLGQGVKTFSEYPTLDRWLNRNTGKYDDKPYQGQGQGYDFKTDNLQTAIDRDLLNDPEQLYLQNPSKNYLSSIDLSKYDNAPPFMHDLEAKAPVHPASIYMDESIYDSVPINKGNDFPSDEEIFNERFVFKPGARKDKRLRTLHNQKTEGLFWNDANQKEYQQLLKEDAAQTKYPKSVII